MKVEVTDNYGYIPETYFRVQVVSENMGEKACLKALDRALRRWSEQDEPRASLAAILADEEERDEPFPQEESRCRPDVTGWGCDTHPVCSHMATRIHEKLKDVRDCGEGIWDTIERLISAYKRSPAGKRRP